MEILNEIKVTGSSEKNPTHRCTYDSSCTFRTVYKASVLRHIKRVHEGISLPKKFHCPQKGCDFRSADSCNVKKHFNSKHKENRQKSTLPCPICTKVLCSKVTLARHVRMHTGEYLYQCDKCEFKTSYSVTLQNHRQVRHLGMKSVPRPKKWKCDKCDLSFPSKANLANHMLVHYDYMPFICTFPGCKFRSKYTTSLQDHKARHSSKRKFPCPMCNKRFKTNYEMDRHIVRIHTAEKSIKCDLCPYTTSLASNLRNHQVEKHVNDGENDSECGTLDKPTAAAGNDKLSGNDDDGRSTDDPQRQLKLEGYYHCEHIGCTFRAKYKPYVVKHGLRVHAQERLHSCSICAKRFFSKSYLVGHVRTHTGERPFKCPFCSYAATLHPNIMRHVKVCHGNEIRNCKSLAKLTQSGKKALADDLPSSLNPSVLLARTHFQFV